jgi:hypothetical protein
LIHDWVKLVKYNCNMALEVYKEGETRYAEVIRANEKVETTKFFSPAESSFQFGLLAHEAGFEEAAHYHKPFTREVNDLQQMFVVQRGKVAVELFRDDKSLLAEIILEVGDAIVLIHGIHAIKVLEDMQCISVKQGPFMGDENDKIFI